MFSVHPPAWWWNNWMFCPTDPSFAYLHHNFFKSTSEGILSCLGSNFSLFSSKNTLLHQLVHLPKVFFFWVVIAKICKRTVPFVMHGLVSQPRSSIGQWWWVASPNSKNEGRPNTGWKNPPKTFKMHFLERCNPLVDLADQSWLNYCGSLQTRNPEFWPQGKIHFGVMGGGELSGKEFSTCVRMHELYIINCQHKW